MGVIIWGRTTSGDQGASGSEDFLSNAHVSQPWAWLVLFGWCLFAD